MTPATPFGITVIAIWVLAQKFSYLSSSSIIELRLENVNEIIDWCIQCLILPSNLQFLGITSWCKLKIFIMRKNWHDVYTNLERRWENASDKSWQSHSNQEARISKSKIQDLSKKWEMFKLSRLKNRRIEKKSKGSIQLLLLIKQRKFRTT